MGNYKELKQAVSDVIKTNGNQEITGAILQNALLTIISTVGANSTFAGIATPNTNPGTPDQNVFWIASTPGIYSNFNNFEIGNEVVIFKNNNGSWTKQNTGFATKGSTDYLQKNVIININAQENSTEEYTLQQAILLVNENDRRLGTKIRFRTSTNPQKFAEATYIAGGTQTENWENDVFWVVTELKNDTLITNWFALGDSITQGYYSEDGVLKGITPNNYPYYVALFNGYNVTNYGVGGSGYVHNGTVDDKLNAKDKVDTIDFSNCDLATLAWGVNDWHYNCQIGNINTSIKGDNTLVGNMKYVIEKILSDNPKTKIVVILPQNSSSFGGDFETNWGLGTSLETSGTLQDVIDAEIDVCEYYGIQYIDQTKNGIVNRYNIQSLLPDGLHPAIDGYLQMAKYLSKQILFI